MGDTYQEFHQLKRKETGAWVNWAMFFQVWWKVRELGVWHDHDWTIKVDPDAVFLPARMRTWLSGRADTEHGVYFEDCHEVFAPCANDGCDWKWGPWGEDVFAQRCMDHHYVDKVEAYDLTTDGACEADRPEGEKKNKKWHAPDCSAVTTPAAHPFKKPEEYMKCMSGMTGQQYVI